MKIGFIGQGWIGKNYANDFEQRGYSVVRYSLEPQYSGTRNAITECDVTFIAVPTPTTPDGFDTRHLEDVLPLVGKKKIAVIKSTLLPGTTTALQQKFPEIFVMHSPEFLVEQTAAYDAAHPNRNIVGIPIMSDEYKAKANLVMSVLPRAPYEVVLPAFEAEFIKYAGNCFLYTKVIFMNLLHDIVTKTGANWEQVREAMVHDPRIGESHTNPVHKNGRGAGGHCFIKDFEAFRRFYISHIQEDEMGATLLKTLAYKNVQLLMNSNKDHDLLTGVYGDLSRFKTWKPLDSVEF
jgi:nucleotide sugar dehydrogenase